ncbi:MAG: hypothetical protein HDR98_10980 [Bacteroides sp.]|nr:hypothetical protein [Bacteroides sp.]
MFDSDILSGVRGVLATLHKSTDLQSTAPEDTAEGRSMRETLRAIASCNPNVSVSFASEGVDSPSDSIRIIVDGIDSGVEFRVEPKGNLLSPFLYAVVNAGGSGFTLDSTLLKRARGITNPIKLMTYVGDHSSMTPRALQVINEIVAVNPGITNVVVDNASGHDIMKRYGVESVPTVLCNDVVISDGWASPEDVVRTLERISA